METIPLKVEQRQEKRKGAARRLRREGRVPGVFYSSGNSAVCISLDAKGFITHIAGLEGTRLIQFDSPEAILNNKVTLLKEVQAHPVTGQILHIDFYEVDLNKKNPCNRAPPLFWQSPRGNGRRHPPALCAGRSR